jgi:hypothetical protein
MTKTMWFLGLATALSIGMAGLSFAAGGSRDSRNTTQAQLGTGQSEVLGHPAPQGAQSARTSTYGLSDGVRAAFGRALMP